MNKSILLDWFDLVCKHRDALDALIQFPHQLKIVLLNKSLLELYIPVPNQIKSTACNI